VNGLSVVCTSKRTVFGNPTAVTLGTVTISTSSKRTVFGTESVTLGALSIAATSAGSGTVYGSASLSPGAVSISTTSKRTVFASPALPLGSLTITATGAGNTIRGSSQVAIRGASIAVVGFGTTQPHGVSGGWSTMKLVQVVRRDSYADGDAAHFNRQLVRRPWQS
jgi:hypothetical protein